MQPQNLSVGVTFNNPVDIILTPETTIMVGKYWDSKMRDRIESNNKYQKDKSTSTRVVFEKLAMAPKVEQIQPNTTLNHRTLVNKMILFQSNLITTTFYFNLGDILSKFGGIYASIAAFFAGLSALFVHSFVAETATLINRKQWYKAYKELIQIMKDILQSDKKLESSDQTELDEIMELSLETYQEGETCMRRLEALIAKHGHSEDAKIVEKQEEINEIKNTDLYSLVA